MRENTRLSGWKKALLAASLGLAAVGSIASVPGADGSAAKSSTESVSDAAASTKAVAVVSTTGGVKSGGVATNAMMGIRW